MTKRTQGATASEETNTVQSVAARKIAQGIFKANPQMEVVSVTADGTAFYTVNDAKNHARSLKSKVVVTVYRNEIDAPTSSEAAPLPPADSKEDNPTPELTPNPEDTGEGEETKDKE